ncbi:3'-5' exonuclease [Tulasnella sp. 330]|nr:3'-5' exonuclease [Tulasnella sp. 330]
MPATPKATKSTTPVKAEVSANWAAHQKNIGPKNVPTPNLSRPQRKRKASQFTSARLLSPASAVPAQYLPASSSSSSSNIIKNMMKSLQKSSKSHPPISLPSSSTATQLRNPTVPSPSSTLELATSSNDIAHLRKMVQGKLGYTREESKPGKYIAIDCEMVGVGPNGNRASLARVSVVNFLGAVLLDAYVKQTEEVFDYRTKWSGIHPEHLESPDAKSFDDVQKLVQELLTDKVLVGHAVFHDLKALMLTHPAASTRDTQKCVELNNKYPTILNLSLRMLATNELKVEIQANEHNSIEDARTAMAIYRLFKGNWDKVLPPPTRPQPPAPTSDTPAKHSTAKSQPPLPECTSLLGFPSSSLALHVDMSTPKPKVVGKQRSPSPRASSLRSKMTANAVRKARAPASQRVQKTKANGGISSGLSVVVRRRGGVKEVKGHGKVRGSRQSGGKSEVRNGATKASTDGGWWSTLS